MNETLRRALRCARLSEDDVAARLQVDPKTVRRWLEGRLPYPRYRWVLTGLLDADEADLWPEVRAALAARSRPAEIKAVYPSRHAVSREAWLSLFGSAEREIGVLACSGLFLAGEPGVLDVLADRARTDYEHGSACATRTDRSPQMTAPKNVHDADLAAPHDALASSASAMSSHSGSSGSGAAASCCRNVSLRSARATYVLNGAPACLAAAWAAATVWPGSERVTLR